MWDCKHWARLRNESTHSRDQDGNTNLTFCVDLSRLPKMSKRFLLV
jgi:hypothetical protein